MTSYELHYTNTRQAEILNEAHRDQLASEYRKGNPSLGQRMIATLGEILESTGSWMKRQASPSTEISRGLPVPR